MNNNLVYLDMNIYNRPFDDQTSDLNPLPLKSFFNWLKNKKLNWYGLLYLNMKLDDQVFFA